MEQEVLEAILKALRFLIERKVCNEDAKRVGETEALVAIDNALRTLKGDK